MLGARPLGTSRRENLACDGWLSAAGWPSRMSRPLAVKGGGACPSMFSTPGLAAGRLARGGGDARQGRAGERACVGGVAPVARRAAHRVSADSASIVAPTDETDRVPAHGEEPAAWRPDRVTLAVLYRTEAAGLVRSLARRGQRLEDAIDIAHEAFLRLARMAPGAAAVERPQAFLRAVAANLLKDRWKADRRRSAALHVVADDRVLPPSDPHAQLEARDMLRRIEAAMARLSPRTREIFMAHRVEGLSYAEIAERTGLTVKGVEKQMSKALGQLDRLVARR